MTPYELWCHMKLDLLTLQISTINDLLQGKNLLNALCYDNHTFILTFSSEIYVVVCLKAPHIGLYLFSDEKEFRYLKSMQHMTDLPYKGELFQRIIFDERCSELLILFEKKILVCELKHNGLIHEISDLKIVNNENDYSCITEKQISEITKQQQSFLAYLFKDVRAYFLKIQRQINLFRMQLQNLPQMLHLQQEIIVFILEHQKQIESKDETFRDLFHKYHIDVLLPFGVIVKNAYKMMHKLETQKEHLPKLIESYEKRLETGYQAPKIKSSSEKLEKKHSRVFFTSTKEKIKVAKSDKDADTLTFKEANGNYFWLHVDNFPGAHTVIFSANPSEEALKIARFLAKFYSKAKDKPSCDVIETQIKFLKKGRKPGEVYVSKKRIIRIQHDKNLEKLLFPSII